MACLILANLIIVLHFIWVFFILFGFIFALMRSKIAFLHLGGLIFSLILNLMGWYCPLTYLEHFLRTCNDTPVTTAAPFLLSVLNRLIYPDVPVFYIRIGGILFVLFNLVCYVYLLNRLKSKSKCQKK
ncbi:MAG: DUF2784 domain-containing protein [Deltaproteobacteria bacterium]|nr:DUF2784 domain-containing protein [Deltaproteobacteria bacterium]